MNDVEMSRWNCCNGDGSLTEQIPRQSETATVLLNCINKLCLFEP